jgi:transcriptional regulator with XRE-family HTH domain
MTDTEKDDFFKILGSHLKKVRKSRRLSIREVELRGDIDRSILSKIENGTRNCTIYTLKKICAALGITLTDFFKDFNQ